MIAALLRGGFQPSSWTLLTTFGGGSTRRAAYRVDLEGGRTLKVRSFLDEARAADNARLRAGFSVGAFAPVLFLHGRIAVEQWIEGAALPPEEGAESVLGAAASLLAALHREAPLPDVKSAPLREEALLGLGVLARERLVGERTLGILRDALLARDPGTARAGIVHGDFCAENIVVAADGALHVVDNEDIALGPLDYDLGRTWYRWPLAEPSFARFLEVYERHAHRPAMGLAFWKIVAAVRGAIVRLRHHPEGLPFALDRLRRLAEA
jgi:hypothetical protein